MATEAFGAPGTSPRWTRSTKDGIGTAYSTSSRLWFTLSQGVVNEVYFPAVDRPQLRDIQFLVADGQTFFQEERRSLITRHEALAPAALGYRITNSDPEGRYRIVKEVIADPHAATLLIHARIEAQPEWRERLRLYVLCAPHLGGTGWGNSGWLEEVAGLPILAASSGGFALALGATIPFKRRSCGFVGASDGWTDLHEDRRMDWQFDRATDGNIALTAELDLSDGEEFTLGLAFGDGLSAARATLLQSLSWPYERHRARFLEQWARTCDDVADLDGCSGDGGRLYSISHAVLRAHEDKLFPGALIASLSIPWGEAKGDDVLGGYHLVWTRDLCNSATALLAVGSRETPLRCLIYLASVQHDDGGFAQNAWIDGTPYWDGVQLDEVSFPIMLAWRLHEIDALAGFDPYPLVRNAARYLLARGPASPQERWEENSGYSPSTLAANIAALVCAAAFARLHGDGETARFLDEYADYLAAHVESWTVTHRGELVPGHSVHYVRITTADPNTPEPDDDPDTSMVELKNQPPDVDPWIPARNLVDGGFLELVRYGIRPADDPLIVATLPVIDAVLKVDLPDGPCWHRYNRDGYGQKANGEPFDFWGRGGVWPLLTGERGHYELAAGRDASLYVRAMERFAIGSGMLPEQLWDLESLPERGLLRGGPSGSAMPLAWAHAEYIKLLRSCHDGRVFDRIDAVAERYLSGRGASRLEVWKFNHQIRTCPAGGTIRLLLEAPARVHWTADGWQTFQDTDAVEAFLGLYYLELPSPGDSGLEFTFFWTAAGHWEGRNFRIERSAT
jgi:glucoamylase